LKPIQSFKDNLGAFFFFKDARKLKIELPLFLM